MKKFTLILLIAITTLIYILNIDDLGLYAGDSIVSNNQEMYRYVTAIFAHADLNHLFSNMVFLGVFGKEVLKRVSSVTFLVIYLISGVVANYASVYYYAIKYPNKIIYTLGASGASFAMLGAVIICLINERKNKGYKKDGIYIFLLPLILLLENASNVNYTAHITGLIVGALLMQIVLIFKRGRYV